MLKFNNTHIFTGYLKQLLASVNLPTCRIYTKEFAEYLAQNGREDPRVLESFGMLTEASSAVRINYLKDNMLYNYFWDYSDEKEDFGRNNASWRRTSTAFYDRSKAIPGLTKTLYSPGNSYDSTTHEYLGDYLRFLRDYHNVNLLSLYNCFTNKICNNMYHSFTRNPTVEKSRQVKAVFDSRDANYLIYAIPVKLFYDYTIAIDCAQGIEMFCGLYSTNLDSSAKNADLSVKTFKRVDRSLFNQPFLYDKLNVKYWPFETDNIEASSNGNPQIKSEKITRWDIANREQDLKLFLKVPTSCKSSIVVLEGNFEHFNDFKYSPKGKVWQYKQNHSILNFNSKTDGIDTNAINFTPISKLQLLAFNSGESFPFADKLIEYLSGSAITPLDEIPDNIKRVQEVMKQNQHYFRINGLWEDKMQKIIYDYIMNMGPVEVDTEGNLVDRHQGYHHSLGHSTKSTLYDVLGYVDRDSEKWYASWKKDNNKAKVIDSIQNVDIYAGLYNL